MADYIREVYAGKSETRIFKSNTGRKQAVNTILLGTWMGVIKDDGNGWLKVKTIGPDGWVRVEDVSDNMGMKLFFIDVGQGDACLVESPEGRFLIDGGPTSNTRSYLTAWKYKWLLAKGYKIVFDALFVTHFDSDHFCGLTKIIEDKRFEFKAIYHNGIARFHKIKNKRPAGYDTYLGKTGYTDGEDGQSRVLLTTFNNIQDAKKLLAKGGLMSKFQKFLEAVVSAHGDGRLGSLRRLTSRDNYVPRFGAGKKLSINVLGPVTTAAAGPYRYKWLKDSSHTSNGHSIVLKFNYGNRSVLLGGDLNAEAEEGLIKHYAPEKPFKASAAKACHHGSSDFSVAFLKAVQPYATVISSGDNENYSHPRADMLGSVGRYSRGVRPMVFSTELARSYRSSEDIHYGLINMRTDGTLMMLAQMLEKRSGPDIWDSYEVPAE